MEAHLEKGMEPGVARALAALEPALLTAARRRSQGTGRGRHERVPYRGSACYMQNIK